VKGKCANYFATEAHDINEIFNKYSPKARWLSGNIRRDEVEVNILDSHRAWGEYN
jgi:hypothetical protein